MRQEIELIDVLTSFCVKYNIEIHSMNLPLQVHGKL